MSPFCIFHLHVYLVSLQPFRLSHPYELQMKPKQRGNWAILTLHLMFVEPQKRIWNTSRLQELDMNLRWNPICACPGTCKFAQDRRYRGISLFPGPTLCDRGGHRSHVEVFGLLEKIIPERGKPFVFPLTTLSLQDTTRPLIQRNVGPLMTGVVSESE